MSSILKALKRLEHEKAARAPEAVRIDAEILRERTSPRRPRYLVYSSVAAMLFFACGVALTYVSVKRDKGTQDVQLATADCSTATLQKPPQAQTLPVPLPKVQKIKPELHIQADSRHVHQPRQRPTAPLPVRPAAASSPAIPPPAAPAGIQAATLTVSSPGRVPTLRVDGIAYHMGSAESLAVVNGLAVYAGAVIEGARVEEISRDRIRFSYNGEKFEVPLGKSNR